MGVDCDGDVSGGCGASGGVGDWVCAIVAAMTVAVWELFGGGDSGKGSQQ